MARVFNHQLYRSLIGGLALMLALGAARLERAAVVSAPINEGVSREIRLANALELTRRVAERFRYIEQHGPIGEVAPWPLRTGADALLTGGDCGHAAAALAAVFVSRGRPFRILQANVGPQGAGHVMFETPDDHGRWVLLDPLAGHGFARPGDGRLLGIDEIRALPIHQRDWLAEEYRTGDLSLFAPYRRTNWARLGPFATVFRAIDGEQRMQETSLRAVVLKSDAALTDGAAIALVATAIAGAMMSRRAYSSRTSGT